METSNRYVHPQSESPHESLQDGDPPVHAERRLDGVSGLEGRLLAGPSPSGQPQVPQICGLESGFSVQGSLFRSLHGSTSFHMGHGSGVDFSSSSGYLDTTLFRRLAYSSSVLSFGSSGFGHSLTSMPGIGYRSQWEKSNLIPSQRVVYLGVIIDPLLFKASPSLPRVEKLFSIVEEFLSCDIQPASSWLAPLGVLYP